MSSCRCRRLKGHDLLVEIKAVSVNPVDMKVRAHPRPPADELKVLGWDAAGIVKAVGADATLFKPGDEVFYAGVINRPGSNAEFHLVDERIVGRKPKTSISRSRRPAADLDHRLRNAVRPAEGAGRGSRSGNVHPDHRRRRRRRLDRHSDRPSS